MADKFQKRHYQFIADTLYDMKPSGYRKLATEQWRSTILEFANRFANASGKFNYDKFLDACGYNEDQ